MANPEHGGSNTGKTNGSTPAQPQPGQTIVIERRERGGVVRKVLIPLFFLFFFLWLLNSSLSRDLAMPTRLGERYVAGEITAPTIAIVEIDGVLMGEEVEHALKQIRQARDDDKVKAVVLRIDSPGGTVSGADRVWRELGVLKGKKPIVASLGGMAASGGYYIAAPADRILAEPTTLTGSIGVLLEIPQVEGLMKKLGVDVVTLTTGEWKDAGSPFRPLSDKERERWHEVIEDAHKRFVRVVAQGRKMALSEIQPLANGKVYTAREALHYRLIDDIGYLDDALLFAQNQAQIESARVIRYARESTLESLLGISASAKQDLRIDARSLLKLQTPQVLLLAR